MGQRIPLSRVLIDLLKERLIEAPLPGGYRRLHGLALNGVIPAEQDPHTLRWSTDEDNLPRIAAIIRADQPAAPHSTSERTAPRAAAKRRAPTLPSAA
jgi:hypothetical protein